MVEDPRDKEVDEDDTGRDAAALGVLGARALLKHALVHSEN